MYGLGWLRCCNLSPQFSNHFVIRGRLKSIWFLHNVLTKTHSLNHLKMEFYTFHGQMNSLLWRKVPLKVYLQCHQTLECFIYIAKKKKNWNKSCCLFKKRDLSWVFWTWSDSVWWLLQARPPSSLLWFHGFFDVALSLVRGFCFAHRWADRSSKLSERAAAESQATACDLQPSCFARLINVLSAHPP